MAHVARYSAQDRLWTVGWYDPADQWHAVRDFATEEEASAFINYLNGGRAVQVEKENASLRELYDRTVKNLDKGRASR